MYETMQGMKTERSVTNIGISISGGGHRATLFGMGALLALTDSNLNVCVRWISSVSGGSLTNAYVATSCDFNTVSSTEFGDLCQRLISRLSRHGSITGNRLGTWIFAVYVMCGAAAIVGIIAGIVAGDWLLSLCLLLVLTVLGTLRGKLIEHGLSQIWTDFARADVDLADLNRAVEHVFSATDIRTGAPVFFSNTYIAARGRVYSLRATPLKLVVRASAAFPVLLPPVRWALSRSINSPHFDGQDDDIVVLSDGGVYNNLGTEWQSSLARLNHDTDGLILSPEIHKPVDIHLVVDCGKKQSRSHLLQHSLPILGDLYSIARTYAATYGSTVQSRLDFLKKFDPSVVLIDSATRPGWGQMYATDGIRMEANRWRLAAYTTRAMGTHLNRVRSDDATLILAHGYAVTLASIRHAAQASESELDQSWHRWLAAAVDGAIPKEPKAFKKRFENLRRRLR
jgi:predicted acylesterase/phospholipase RssA